MRYPLFGAGQKGVSVNVSSQRRLNCYAEAPQDPEKDQYAFYGTPGLRSFISISTAPFRGFTAVGNYMYGVRSNLVTRYDNAAAETVLGTLNTSGGWVCTTDDRANIMFVDGLDGWVYDTTAGTLTQITSPDFPAGAKTCTWSDQYFIVEDGTAVQISGLGQPLVWDATDRKESESNPDGIMRVFADHGELVVFGDKSIEFWANTGNADFPYERIGSGVAEWGMVAVRSLCQFAVREGESSLMLLARKRGMTNAQICLIVGYTLKPVSPPALEAEINSYSGISNATAFSYSDRGHPFYQINFPSANKSWMYDGLTGLWSERTSGEDRHRGEIGVEFLNSLKLTDWEKGKIYTLDHNAFDDDGIPVPMEMDTRHIFDEDNIVIGSLQLDVETGVGTNATPAPQVMMKVSRDAGHTWSSEVWRSMGAVGEYARRVIWRRLGAARDRVFRFRITAAVKRVILGGWIEAGK